MTYVGSAAGRILERLPEKVADGGLISPVCPSVSFIGWFPGVETSKEASDFPPILRSVNRDHFSLLMELSLSRLPIDSIGSGAGHDSKVLHVVNVSSKLTRILLHSISS